MRFRLVFFKAVSVRLETSCRQFSEFACFDGHLGSAYIRAVVALIEDGMLQRGAFYGKSYKFYSLKLLRTMYITALLS